MTKENKLVYGMVAVSLLLVGGFITMWTISSKRVVAGKSSPTVERYVDRDVALLDANGQERGFQQLRGKVSLVSHVFTRCPGQCAGIGVVLDEVRQEYRDKGPLHLVSVSLDPEHDRPENLKEFSTGHGLAGDDWWFVTGEAEVLNPYMADVFWLKAEKKPEEKRASEFDLYDHQPMVVLVDHELKLVGWYFPFDEKSAASLRKDLEAALAAANKATS